MGYRSSEIVMDYIHNGCGVELASSKNSATFFPYFLHRWLITYRLCALAQPPVGFFFGMGNEGSKRRKSSNGVKRQNDGVSLGLVWGFASGS